MTKPDKGYTFESVFINARDENQADLYQKERSLRFQVLRKPLGPQYLHSGAEFFEFELDAIHCLAIDRNEESADNAGDGVEVIGCVLFNPDESGASGRLFQMAVDPLYQRSGVGRKLVETLESHLAGIGFKEVQIHARMYALPFYEKLGYVAYGDEFTEVGIPHRNMRKSINQ